MKKMALMTIVGLCASAASAQITQINPFTGDKSENWDDPDPLGAYGYACPPCFLTELNSFGGDARFTDAGGGNGMHLTGGWGFGCTIFAQSSPRLFGSAGGATRIDFAKPVSEFGAYMGSNAPGGNTATVEFFDASGASIGTQDIASLDCEWRWNGWSSTTPISAMVITGGQFGGGFVQIDDMELNFADGSSCYADCDGSGNLNIDDFICFQTNYALGDPAADCDGSGSLNIDDFICFQTFYALGC